MTAPLSPSPPAKEKTSSRPASKAIVTAVESPEPPLHLILGNNAFNSAKAKLHVLGEEFDKWEDVPRGADFAKEAHATVV